MPINLIVIPNPPTVHGLTFRHFQGDNDFSQMASVLTASSAADGEDRIVNGGEIASAFENYLTNCDPHKDIIMAQIQGKLVGYARGWWHQETTNLYIYKHNAFLLPEWRRKGIGTAMLSWIENRLDEIGGTHPIDAEKLLQVSVSQYQGGAAALLKGSGYKPVRYFYHMVRPDLEDIPYYPLPDGLEIYPVNEDQFKAIWELMDETSQDEWGNTPPTEDTFREWLNHPHFQPHLWTIAWDKVSRNPVGQVLAFINHDENTQFNRLRGYTEGIGVSKNWRRRGVAHTLISMSLQTQRGAGMTESALVADRGSDSGAISLYESCGFQVVTHDTIYRKQILSQITKTSASILKNQS